MQGKGEGYGGQVTYILHQLKDNGFDVDPSATTIEEAKETILQAVRKNSK